MDDDTGDTEVAADSESEEDARPATMVATWDVVPDREAAFRPGTNHLLRVKTCESGCRGRGNEEGGMSPCRTSECWQ
jgi:hypothetical protein